MDDWDPVPFEVAVNNFSAKPIRPGQHYTSIIGGMQAATGMAPSPIRGGQPANLAAMNGKLYSNWVVYGHHLVELFLLEVARGEG